MSGQRCTACGTGRLVPILWGLPEPAAMEASERGEVFIGGCVMPEVEPQVKCRDCGMEFFDPEGRLIDLVAVPSPAAPTMEILEFALSYDGYQRHGGVVELKEYAQPVLRDLEAGRRPPPALDMLRAALFFLQRQTHHWGDLPIEQERWMRALVVDIGGIAQSVIDDRTVS